MILIVSDLHLGKEPDRDAKSLESLAQCIRASGASHVVFLGDVFDAFIESDRHIPTVVRDWAAMADSIQANRITIRYIMGNHDRWHRRYVKSVIGSAPVRDFIALDWAGMKVRLEHGDKAQDHVGMTSLARRVSDQAWAHRLYTTFLPFGAAQALAAAVSKRYASFEANPVAISELTSHARTLCSSGEWSGVVMGHCHHPGLHTFADLGSPTPWYANSGDWYQRRSFLLLDEVRAMIRLCRWTEGRIQDIETLEVG